MFIICNFCIVAVLFILCRCKPGNTLTWLRKVRDYIYRIRPLVSEENYCGPKSWKSGKSIIAYAQAWKSCHLGAVDKAMRKDAVDVTPFVWFPVMGVVIVATERKEKVSTLTFVNIFLRNIFRG